MKKFILLIIYSFLAQSAFAQLIEGQVVDKITNEPLMGASIYFDRSSIGTLSDENGYFKIDRAGRTNAKLIVSYVGYSTFTIKEQSTQKLILITLSPKAEQLNEVVLKADQFSRKQKLEVFRAEFLGESKAASKSSILNEADIELFYNSGEKTLSAFSKEPILIKNNYLGYEIKVDLQEFKIFFKDLSLSRFDNIKYTFIKGYNYFTDTAIADNKKTISRRKKSFLGSLTHFMRSMRESNLITDGFKFRKDGKKIPADVLFKRRPQIDLDLKEMYLDKGKISIKYSLGIFNYRSTLDVPNSTILSIDRNGNYQPFQNLIFGGYMAELRIADMLPTNYTLPIE